MNGKLIERLHAALASKDVNDEAIGRLQRVRSLGLVSDWAEWGDARDLDFARLTIAVERTFRPGGSIETGVFKGGTSGLLILGCSPQMFHVGIDPYGLPSQAYPSAIAYGDWQMARQTLHALTGLALSRHVTYCQYFLDSMTFCGADLFQFSTPFNIVHLDGDHSFECVHKELEYFTGRLSGPVVYVLDDYDDHFPDVERAFLDFRTDMQLVRHHKYELEGYGIAGTSAWLSPGVDGDDRDSGAPV